MNPSNELSSEPKPQMANNAQSWTPRQPTPELRDDRIGSDPPTKALIIENTNDGNNAALAQTQVHQVEPTQIHDPEATQRMPTEVREWLIHAAQAETYEGRLACLSEVLNLVPNHVTAQQRMYETLKDYLEQHPFLRYSGETEYLYQVSTKTGLDLVLAKERAIAPAYPLPSTPLRPVFRWLALAVIGLLFAGLGTLFCAPMAALSAWKISRRSPDPIDRSRARTAMIYAYLLTAVGLVLSGLFLLHL